MSSKKIMVCSLCFFILSFTSETVYGNGIGPSHPAADVLQFAIPAVAFGATFLYGDSEGRTQFYKSGAACLAVTQGLKRTIFEERPAGHGTDSFPSGHTSSSFLGASFIQRRYGWTFGVPAYILASYVGWSRVDSKAHYVHDVLAGAAIGVVSTYLFTTPFTENITVMPLVGEDSVGLGFQVKF
jgi:membrane-associated phospholipid phosphatase